MAKLKMHKYRFKANAINLTNYAVFTATAILVLITAHAKSTNLNDNNLDITTTAPTSASSSLPTQLAVAVVNAATATSATSILDATELAAVSSSAAAPAAVTTAAVVDQEEPHHRHKPHKHKSHQYQHHHQHHQHHHQQQQQQPPPDALQHKHRSHQHSSNMVTPHESLAKRPYHSKFTIEELLNTKFMTKVSHDIDMDPCKASGFMGDIALPDGSYYPVVAHTDSAEWQPQADEPIPAASIGETALQFNATFQQELELLKQQVYHEGLQVEEEGLTDIIRKKTKLPSSSSIHNMDKANEQSRNDPILSANEPVKPTGGYTPNSEYSMRNLKNEIIEPQQWRRDSGEAAALLTEMEYFKPKISIRTQQPANVDTGEVLPQLGGGRPGAATLQKQQQLQHEKRGYDVNDNVDNDDADADAGGVTSAMNRNGNSDVDVAVVVGNRDRVATIGLSESEAEAEKLNKSSTARLAYRGDVDQRKIQSNTKDIEDDSGNNFVAQRKVVILPTSLPTQRSTLPNVFSNAGGNGMKLDASDVEFLRAEGAVVRRRHRRGRKHRRSSDTRSEYSRKLQRLREELNRPIRTAYDFHMPARFRQTNENANLNRFPYKQHQHQHQRQRQRNHDNNNEKTTFKMPHSHPHPHPQPQRIQSLAAEAAQSFNYSSESADEVEVLTKRKSTMNANTAELERQQELEPEREREQEQEEQHTSLETELQNAESVKHLKQRHRMARAVTAKKERIWDYGVIPYEIDGNFSGLHKALFKQAMRHWENSTCIKFVERNPEIHPNYIVFTVRSCGCCSFVGKRGNGPQAISIGRNCDKFGIVVHELGHVVGFWHEHTRPDREKHVVIEHNNIMKGQDYNFNKLTPDEVDSLGMAYDYDSIMHYARNTFSKGTYLDTILPIEVKGKKRPEIGQRLRLSAGDIAQANLLYKCPKCGRTFQENTGIFASPSFYTGGALTNETEHCEWRITATHGERVVLRLENLNILKTNNCQTDYLEVRDGYYYKSPLIGRFCGKVNGEIVTTESSRLLLTYVNTHRTEGYRGFKAEYDVICGGELSVDDAEGRLESPNYPLDYLPNKECVWKITVPKGYQVALKFQSFEVENHDSCVYDFVEVRDGPMQDSPLIGVFCGYKPPPNMKSSGNSMFVKFVSDTSVQKAGFSAIFMKEVDECETQNHGCEHDCINTLGGYECSCHIGYELHSDKKHCEDACGGVIEYPNGTITSPSFPDMYPVLKECIWEIIAPPKHKISLNFTHFDLEGTTHQQSDCGYDSVTIYSKLSENRLKRIGTFCGSAIPPTATSEGNALRVEFHSDKSIQRSGFAAVFFTDIDECSVNNGGCQHECRNTIGSYMCSCHNGYSLHENGHDCKEGECKHEISAPFGTIYSPNYPDLYPPNADCVWHFSTTPGHRIKLIFNEFNVESHQECAYDNVAIYDGESESSSTLGRFCGDKIPYPISSSTNQLYMVLKTDKNKQLNGFTAMHSTSCGGYLRATNQIQQFYSHARFGNLNYDENMDCEWTIQAPASSNVQLLFLTFDIESSENCTYDYVQVYSGMEDTSGPMYGQYCGNTLPQDIISLTDSLLVRFKTDSSVTMKGFSASYVAVDPFENSDEDVNSYSSEMVTPFPGYLKSIYKEEETQESDDYSDFSENHLVVNSPYRPRSRYQNRL